MKKLFKIFIITLLSFLLLIAIAIGIVCFTIFSPSKLTPIINKLANKYLNAEVNVEKVNLCLVSSYPFVGLELDNLLILNKNQPYDTLSCVNTAKLQLNLYEFVKKNNLILTNLEFYGGTTNVIIDSTGELNWNIFPQNEDNDTNKSTPIDSLFNMVDIQQITINSGRVNYHNNKEGQLINAENANITIKGSFIEHKLLSNMKLDLQNVDANIINNKDTLILKLQNANLNMEGSYIEEKLVSDMILKLKNIDVSYYGEQNAQHIKLENANIKLKGSFKENLISDLVLDLQNIDYKSNPNIHFSNLALDFSASTNFKDGKIRLQTTIDRIGVEYDKIPYLKNSSISLRLATEFLSDDKKILIDDASFWIDDVPFQISGTIDIKDSITYYPKLKFNLTKVPFLHINALLPDKYSLLLSEYAKINSGEIRCNGTVNGCFSKKSLPNIDLSLELQNMDMVVNNSHIDDFNLLADASVKLNNLSISSLSIKKLSYLGDLGKASLTADVVGFTENPHVSAVVSANLNLARLKNMFAESNNYQTNGQIHADIKGEFDLVDLMQFSPDRIKVDGRINIDSLVVKNDVDSLNVLVDLARVRFGSQVDDTTLVQGMALFKTNVRLDSLNLNYKGIYTATVARLFGGYKCEAIVDNAVSSQTIRLSFRGLRFRMPKERLRFNTGRTSLSLKIVPNPEKPLSPVGNIKLIFDTLQYRYSGMGIRLHSSELNIALKPQIPINFNSQDSSSRRSNRDTTQAARQQQRLNRLKEMSSNQFIETFLGYATNKNDSIDISQKFMDEFSYEGSLIFDTLRLRVPDFPLPIIFTTTDVGITSRVFSLKNAHIRMGNSDLLVSGSLENFKRALFNNGTLRGNIQFKSKKIDCNQLMLAMSQATAKADSTKVKQNVNNVNEAAFFDSEIETTETASLLSVPKTLNLKMKANIDSLVFGKSILVNLYGEVEVKDEYLRLNQFRLTNGAGDMELALAYKANNHNEARVWADILLKKVELQNLLQLYPEMDSVLPMARSFEGLVDCSLTAVTALDSTMSVNLLKTKASCNLRGENLVLLDGETFQEIAKTLMFKDKAKNIIDSISVDLIVNENTIEIFPFKLTMDRYDLAVGGVQNLDMSFNYHITVLSSPVPFKMGLDISGTVDKIKTKIVAPRYKKIDSPAISLDLKNRTISLQDELKRILDYEFEEIIGGKK